MGSVLSAAPRGLTAPGRKTRVSGGANGTALNTNELLVKVQHPDKTTGNPSATEQDTYTYNNLGEVSTFADRNGNVHTYLYNEAGQQKSDAVTTLGAGVDGSVRRRETGYDTAGRPYLFTT